MPFQIIKDKNADIILGKGCRYHLSELINGWNDVSSIVILSDENTRIYCLPLLKTVLDEFSGSINTIDLATGEKIKSVETFNSVIKQLIELKIDRKSVIINVGGGVLTDLGAYVATVYKRGLRFINIPTSLIGQVDAAIGGKTGINFDHIKNVLGTFSQPECIIVDFDFLETLPKHEFCSAYPEILKYGLIHDIALYKHLVGDCMQYVEENILNGEIIQKCIESKLYFVNKDPHDFEERNALNLGHTVGHAIEAVFNGNEKSILHGEAVGIGIICSLFISCQMFNLDEAILKESQNFILKNVPYFDISYHEDNILEAMYQDKKNESGQIKYTLLKETGLPLVKQSVESKMIKGSLDYYKNISR